MVFNRNVLRDFVVSIVGERGLMVIERFALFAVAALAIWALITQLDLTVNGLLVGAVYALGAVGLSLVYGNLHLPNIAHGDYMTLGAFIALFVFGTIVPEAWSMNSVGPFTFPSTLFIALPIGVLVVAIFAVVVDQLVYRTMRRRGRIAGCDGAGIVGCCDCVARDYSIHLGNRGGAFPERVEEVPSSTRLIYCFLRMFWCGFRRT